MKNIPESSKRYRNDTFEKEEDHPFNTTKTKYTGCLGKVSNILGLFLLKNKVFLFLLAASFPMEVGSNTYIYFGITRAIHQGIPPVSASFINSAMGLCAIIGRVSAGVIGSLVCTNRKLYYSIAVMLSGVVVMVSTLAGTYLALHLVFAALFALFFGKSIVHCFYLLTILLEI